jgi:hypothetical protein
MLLWVKVLVHMLRTKPKRKFKFSPMPICKLMSGAAYSISSLVQSGF